MRALFLLLLLCLTGCAKYDLAIEREFVDRNSLASTYVKSPDPMQKDPPFGQKLWMVWSIPEEDVEKGVFLTLKVILKNYREERISYPISRAKGFTVYELLNEDFKTTGGIFTYMGEITDSEGNILTTYKHAMWFNLIEEMRID